MELPWAAEVVAAVAAAECACRGCEVAGEDGCFGEVCQEEGLSEVAASGGES